jgi:formylglycine-generating enzyme required for sulfatase activity
MAQNKAQEPHNRPDPEKGVKRPERPVASSQPPSVPTRAPASRSDAGFEPELVLIPGSRFTMGSDRTSDRYSYDDEHPQHQVSLAEFHIAKYPITNAQYQHFVKATGHRMPPHLQVQYKPDCDPGHPVVWVSWEDANAYCAWLSQATGRAYRLPTEAEWEKAARGRDARAYPWGDEPPNKRRCAFENHEGVTATPVGQYSPQGDSPYGCGDMAGNVWEWCHSLYKPYPYDPTDGREDPATGGPRVLRGGAFYTNLRRVRCASRLRYFPHLWLNVIGFRVVAVSAAL